MEKSNQEGEPMQYLQTFEWESRIPWKKEREDSLFLDDQKKVLVVADGVSRTKNEQREYPYPSPALMASKVASEAMGKSLLAHEEVSEDDVRQAFADGNTAVRKLNEELGLWENHDYYIRDFAGAVASCAIEKGGEIVYGYIGDCGIAHVSASGEILWHSDDDVAAARPGFPPMEGEPAFAKATTKVKERFVKVRRDFRNNPTANYKTFGVLTGEDTALAYVKTGQRSYSPGDVLVVYSDGISPFVFEDLEFRKLLLKGDKEEIQQYVAERSSQEKDYDEKTLILLRTGKE